MRFATVSSAFCIIEFAFLVSLVSSFSSISRINQFAVTRQQRINEITSDPLSVTLMAKKEVVEEEEDPNNFLDTLFTGGAFDNAEEEAAGIASKIKSIKELGWTKPPRDRPGNIRPRHRAWGGTGEKAIQDKPGYDVNNPRSPEIWLKEDDFYALKAVSAIAKKSPTGQAAADTVFVALAGGGSFAERTKCEELINDWNKSGKFDDAAFRKSVDAGRAKLATGWAAFFGVTATCALSIAVPTNPVAKGLEAVIGVILGFLSKL
mmetsp:Transcript_37369/g.37700  ORF Transcript_37369/g.37700 Transcript_37369/m.37700 type:complete len:263 (-) Transcript_37369:457-1245(-)|eukprot:CAMPEP_0171295776 /NCGR_PEP_ID=MMETSP0816-20121228/4404_1 /TAXON_ID=420281 /ORGANISM="Proboscia inermis, Strain CCAP1064/1" /LENGTH=262 /DNA_ID=CAMNT_0011768711 /DNA_START=16 /DNA_END=804 /DNA_ORIENTATION=+